MAKTASLVIKPRICGLDDYMAKVERLLELLNEASELYGSLEDASLEVDYTIESPTLNSCPHPVHSPSPDEMSTVDPQEGH